MIKKYQSEHFNQTFNTETGVHMYWGTTPQEDPLFCVKSPLILDIEISSGFCTGNCRFCYKENEIGKQLHNMTLTMFKRIMSTMHVGLLTQVAFGICDIDTNPDMWDMFRHCRSLNIIPNYTTNGLRMTPELAELSAQLCGAVAVSVVDKKRTFEAVDMLISAGVTQTNIHYVLSYETYTEAFSILDEAKKHNVNAVVFLRYKPKGKGKNEFSVITNPAYYTVLADYAKKIGQNIGFDSCSAHIYLESLTPEEQKKQLPFIDPCESTLFSGYINSYGKFFPCSFAEEGEGLDVLSYKDFKELWLSYTVNEFRTNLLCNKRKCPLTFGVK